MTDDELLLSHARDLKQRAADRGMLTHTSFLDLHQRSVLSRIERELNADVQTFYCGGYPDAERTVAVFVPRFYGIDDLDAYFMENSADNPLCLLRLEKDAFSTLSHRDYLGALMGLSVKRETLGDILPDETGAFLVCLQSIRQFLLDNLFSAGRATLTVTEAPLESLGERQQNVKDFFVSVPSMRLDCVAAAAFRLSRTKAEQAIRSGLVFVNAVQTDKTDKKLDVGDVLVLRGKGKCKLLEQTGESKKGRLHLTVRQYL